MSATDAAIEAAFREGFDAGSHVPYWDDADADDAWRHSKAREALTSGAARAASGEPIREQGDGPNS